jgi:type I restriction enzyme S subunit
MMEGYKDSLLGLIPNDWELKTLGELLEVNTGSKNAQDSVVDGEFPFFTRSVNTQKIDTYSFDTEALFIAGEGIFKVKHYEGKFDVHQRTYILTRKNDVKSSLKFLQNQIQSRIVKLVDTSVGSTVQSLRKPIIQDLKLVVPPLPEQQKIAEILSTVDAKIEVIDQQIIETQALKKGLMQRLLTKGIGHTEFKDSPLGEIPKSWEVKRLSDVAKITSGGTPNRSIKEYWNGNVPWITTSLIKFNSISTSDEFITDLAVENSSAKLFPKGTILMAMYGQGVTRGKVALLNIEATTNQACCAIITNDEVINYFLFYQLQYRYEELRTLSNAGGQENLSGGIIKSIMITVPPLKEQINLIETLTCVDDKLEVLSEKKSHYQELKQGLMQQLLTGKIRVKINNTVTT